MFKNFAAFSVIAKVMISGETLEYRFKLSSTELKPFPEHTTGPKEIGIFFYRQLIDFKSAFFEENGKSVSFPSCVTIRAAFYNI